MGRNRITGVFDSASTQDVATKIYVDTLGGLKLTKAGDNVTSILGMRTNNITGVADPIAAEDVATKTMDLLEPKYVINSNTIPAPINSDITLYIRFLLTKQSPSVRYK